MDYCRVITPVFRGQALCYLTKKSWLRNSWYITHGSHYWHKTVCKSHTIKLAQDIMFSRAALEMSFCKHKQLWKQPNLYVQLWRQCFINLWTQTMLFLIIGIAASSAAVSWQFAEWILPNLLRLVISISTDYIPSLLTKYGVHVVVKYCSKCK